MSRGSNSSYIGVDKRTAKAGSYGLEKHYLERLGGNFKAPTPPSGSPLLDTYGSAAVGYSLRLLRTAYAGDCIKAKSPLAVVVAGCNVFIKLAICFS